MELNFVMKFLELGWRIPFSISNLHRWKQVNKGFMIYFLSWLHESISVRIWVTSYTCTNCKDLGRHTKRLDFQVESPKSLYTQAVRCGTIFLTSNSTIYSFNPIREESWIKVSTFIYVVQPRSTFVWSTPRGSNTFNYDPSAPNTP